MEKWKQTMKLNQLKLLIKKCSHFEVNFHVIFVYLVNYLCNFSNHNYHQQMIEAISYN